MAKYYTLTWETEDNTIHHKIFSSDGIAYNRMIDLINTYYCLWIDMKNSNDQLITHWHKA